MGNAIAKSWAVGQRVGVGVDMASEMSGRRGIARRTRTVEEGREVIMKGEEKDGMTMHRWAMGG